jgi:hypothetical protein
VTRAKCPCGRILYRDVQRCPSCGRGAESFAATTEEISAPVTPHNRAIERLAGLLYLDTDGTVLPVADTIERGVELLGRPNREEDERRWRGRAREVLRDVWAVFLEPGLVADPTATLDRAEEQHRAKFGDRCPFDPADVCDCITYPETGYVECDYCKDRKRLADAVLAQLRGRQ